MKRIVLFAEGHGEDVALVRLVKRLLTEQGVWERRNFRLRSFRRLEAALAELVSAIREDTHVATPILRA